MRTVCSVIIGSYLRIAAANEDERARVRTLLRSNVWTKQKDPVSVVQLLPALFAALGLQIEIDPPVPAARSVSMTTLNMRLTAFLADLADRMDLRFTHSVRDPLADSARVRPGSPAHRTICAAIRAAVA